MWVVRPGVIQYACRDGFRENGTGVSLIECRGNRWTSLTPLECVPIQPEVEPPAGKRRLFLFFCFLLLLLFTFEDGPLVGFMYLVCTGMPGESYCRQLKSLLL